MSELTKEDEYGIISRTMMNIRSLRVFAREVDFEQLLEMQESSTLLLKNVVKMLNVKRLNGLSVKRKRQELLQLIARGFLTGRTAWHYRRCAKST